MPFQQVRLSGTGACIALLMTFSGCVGPGGEGFWGQYDVACLPLGSFGTAKIAPYGYLYYPSADGTTVDPAAGPCPVILFLPGYLEPPLLYQSYGEQAASWGYAVLVGHFIGFSDDVLTQDVFRLLDWLRDQHAGEGLLAGKLDLGRLGMAGHSIGGKHALLISMTEPSIKAVVAIDPVDGAAGIEAFSERFRSFTPEFMPQVTAPTCIVGAEAVGPLNPVEENYHEFYRHATCPAEEVLVHGSDHASFCDDFAGLAQRVYDYLFGGKPTRDARARVVAARFMIAWFEVFLRGRPEAATYLTGDEAKKDVARGVVTISTNDALPEW